MLSILPFLLGGLVLFLYAIFQLSEVMKDLFTDRAKSIIEKRTSNLVSTLLIGYFDIHSFYGTYGERAESIAS